MSKGRLFLRGARCPRRCRIAQKLIHDRLGSNPDARKYQYAVVLSVVKCSQRGYVALMAMRRLAQTKFAKRVGLRRDGRCTPFALSWLASMLAAPTPAYRIWNGRASIARVNA
jgi:hypothetical protein